MGISRARQKRYQAGTVILMVAIAMPALLALTTLALEGGRLRVARAVLQHAADAAALAAVLDLPNTGQASATGRDFAALNAPGHGQIVELSDVRPGNWDFVSRVFMEGGTPLNAVQVTALRVDARGNAMPSILALAFGKESFDVVATAVAVFTGAGGAGTSSRFLIDAEMIDSDIPSIEDLADELGIDSEDLISDLNDDGYIDLPPGTELDVPTGQVGDEALFDIDHPAFPFSDSSEPSFADFLNYNENGTWRQELLEDEDLDPLPGPSPVDDGSLYDQYVGMPCQVSPVWKSDVSTLNPIEQGLDPVQYPDGIPAINAKGERRGLLAFKIIAILDDPDGPGSVLPNIRIKICPPVDPAMVTGPAGGGGGNASALVM